MAYRPSESTYFDSEDDSREIRRSRQGTEMLLGDPMMKMKWFHPFLTRHAAECMLIDNAPEGCYLLRPSASGDTSEYALSVKFSQSVQHIKVKRLADGKYHFGQTVFENEVTLRRHIEHEKPIIGGENNIKVVLKYPYSREIEEQHIYTDLQHHAATKMIDLNEDSDSESSDSSDSTASWDVFNTLQRLPYVTPISSREGYLTKRGQIRKNWKIRWFVLRNTMFAYYKTKQSERPIRVIDMMQTTAVEYDTTTGKDFCFRIVSPKRTFFMYANSDEDCEQWVKLLQSKIFIKHSNRESNNLEEGSSSDVDSHRYNGQDDRSHVVQPMMSPLDTQLQPMQNNQSGTGDRRVVDSANSRTKL